MQFVSAHSSHKQIGMEDSPPTNRPKITRLEQLEDQYEALYESASKNPDLLHKITQNLETLLFVWSALIQGKGQPGWLAKAKDALGNPIFEPAEAAELEKKIKPLADSVLAFSSASSESHPTPLFVQKGGNAGSPYGMDEAASKAGQVISQINTAAHRIATSDYGLLKMMQKHDDLNTDYDYGPIAIPFIPLDESFSFNILSKIPLPLRTIVFVSDVVLDALRLLFSVPGLEMPFLRKMLSIGLAILELLQGDWKQSLLSLAGVYSESAVYAGIFGKVVLDIFALINPEFQEQILDGIVPVSKSIVIGFLLKGFQVLAPARLRRMVIDQLEVFQKLKAETDKGLEGAGLPHRPEYFSPSFEDIQTVQSFIRDRGLLCSEKYETFMNVMNQSIFVKLPFQMLGLPMDNETYKKMCAGILEQYPRGTPTGIAEGVVGDGQLRQAAAAAAAAPTTPVTGRVGASTTIGDPSAPPINNSSGINDPPPAALPAAQTASVAPSSNSPDPVAQVNETLFSIPVEFIKNKLKDYNITQNVEHKSEMPYFRASREPNAITLVINNNSSASGKVVYIRFYMFTVGKDGNDVALSLEEFKKQEGSIKLKDEKGNTISFSTLREYFPEKESSTEVPAPVPATETITAGAKPVPWLIVLDFDKTLAPGHSNGHPLIKDAFVVPNIVEKTAKEFVATRLESWIRAGFAVMINSRSIESQLREYLTATTPPAPGETRKWFGQRPEIFNKDPCNYKPNLIGICAVKNDTEMGADAWAANNNIKIEKIKTYVREMVAAGNPPHRILFADDTEINFNGEKPADPGTFSTEKTLDMDGTQYPILYYWADAGNYIRTIEDIDKKVEGPSYVASIAGRADSSVPAQAGGRRVTRIQKRRSSHGRRTLRKRRT